MTKASHEAPPAWVARGQAHLWRPYCQMKNAALALPVVATDGTRLTLADGRVLIDGIASWRTACHGYNHPHIAEAVRRQLERMPHVMFGGLTHEPAATLAARFAALLPGDLDHGQTGLAEMRNGRFRPGQSAVAIAVRFSRTSTSASRAP